MTYKYNKKWRLSHTELRNKGRKRYYAKFRRSGDWTRRKRWSVTDSDFIIMSTLSDRFLSFSLGRSVQAIQVKRCSLRKEGT